MVNIRNNLEIGRRGSTAGYTLIEFAGVLAIVAILATALLPVVITDVENSLINAETANLSNIENALVFEITHTCQIPSENTWASTVGTWLMSPSASVATNARGYSRIYVYDSNGFGGLTLPYSQTNGLGVLPANPRLMIVSSLSANLPDSSGGLSSNEFTAIWNTTTGTLPSTWTSWKGNAGDLLIQRINLQPLFCRLVLNAIDTNVFGSISVQSGQTVSAYMCVLTNSTNVPVINSWNLVGGVVTSLGSTVFAGSGSSGAQTFNTWYLQGTVINFYDTNSGPTSPALESQLAIQNDSSYVYENTIWRGLLSGWGTNGPGSLSASSSTSFSGAGAQANAFEALAATFGSEPLDSNDSNGAGQGDSTQAVLSSFYTLMLDYNFWAVPPEAFLAGSDNWDPLGHDATAIQNITQKMSQ